jgi:hypothetical protein
MFSFFRKSHPHHVTRANRPSARDERTATRHEPSYAGRRRSERILLRAAGELFPAI